MIGRFITLDELVTNASAPYLNDIKFPYLYLASGITKLQFAIDAATTRTTILTLEDSSQGEFFSDAAATVSLGTKVEYTTGGQKTVYFVAAKAGAIILRNPYDITALGLLTGDDWAPANYFVSDNFIKIAGFDILQLIACSNMKRINLLNCFSIGNISVFANMPTLALIAMSQGSNLYGLLEGSSAVFRDLPLITLNFDFSGDFDVRDIPSTIVRIQIPKFFTKRVVNTGTAISPSIATVISYFSVNGIIKLTSAATDTFLQALAASLLNNPTARTLQIAGTRTSASDAAIATLTSKNYTVQFI